MVKGISKQVIMVRSPDGELFDQAIFILKDRQTADVSDEQLLRQANRAVEHYVHTSFKGGRAAQEKSAAAGILYGRRRSLDGAGLDAYNLEIKSGVLRRKQDAA